MLGLFRKNKTATAPAEVRPEYPTAPGTEIRYSPDLVPQLKQEHAALLALYGNIATRFEQSDYAAVSRLLGEFRATLQGHLLSENVRLYIYLDRQLGRDEMNGELIREFRREMDGIGKAVMSFLKKYETIGVDKELAPAFKKDFEAIGAVLVQRVTREENTLYPLYMPHY